VAAGFDRFTQPLIEQYLGGYAMQKLGITLYDLLALGRHNPNDSSESFNMAYLAIRGSGAVKWCESPAWGSQPASLVSLFFLTGRPNEVPVGHRDYGSSHADVRDSASHGHDTIWTEACGKDRLVGDDENYGAEHSKYF